MNPEASAFVPKKFAAPKPIVNSVAVAMQPSQTAAAAVAGDEEKSDAPKGTRVYLSNVHKLVSGEELAKDIKDLTGTAPVKAEIVYVGPKSSGCAVVEMASPELAARVVASIDDHLIRSSSVTASLVQPSTSTQRRCPPAIVQKQPKNGYEEEVVFLQQQYAEGYEFIRDGPPYEVAVAVKMPSDFPFDIDGQCLRLRVSFPVAYPGEPCIIAISNEDIPERLRTKINQAIAKRTAEAYSGKGNPAMASGLIRWIKNNAERLLVDKAMTEEHKSGIHIVVGNKGKAHEIEDDPSLLSLGEVKKTNREDGSTTTTDESDDTSSDEYDEESKAELAREREAGTKGKQQMYPSSTAHTGTQMVAQNLRISGVGIVTCSTLSLVFTCARCNTQDTASLVPGDLHAQDCPKCRALVSMRLRPEPMHENSCIVGYLDVEGCRPMDVLPSNFLATCLGCASEIPLRTVQFAVAQRINCFQCHSATEVYIERISFSVARRSTPTAETADESRKAARKKKAPKDPREAGIRVGHPLPQEGTCKHYKKSFRWLRFPCCGRAWPCDQCHDENSDHPHVWATRMLCGLCSKEQPFSATKPCPNCGHAWQGKAAAFWQGGTGCRDKTKMSKKDSKKYSGTSKTKSSSKK